MSHLLEKKREGINIIKKEERKIIGLTQKER